MDLHRRDLLFTTPSRSQPSLASRTQRVAAPRTLGQERSVSSAVKPSNVSSSAGISQSFSQQPTAREPKTTRPGVRKTLHTWKVDSSPGKESPKKTSGSAKKVGTRTPASYQRSASADVQSLGSANASEVDVTTYLINRMLGREQAPLPDAADRRHNSSAAHRKKTDGGDNLSDTGTYTIDDEEESGGVSGQCEVQKARDRIEEVFGISGVDGRRMTGDSLVRPIVDEEDTKLLRLETAEGDDVFEMHGDSDQLQTKYVS